MCCCDSLAIGEGLVHVLMSLWARTSVQDDSDLAQIPMSSLSEERCASHRSEKDP